MNEAVLALDDQWQPTDDPRRARRLVLWLDEQRRPVPQSRAAQAFIEEVHGNEIITIPVAIVRMNLSEERPKLLPS